MTSIPDESSGSLPTSRDTHPPSATAYASLTEQIVDDALRRFGAAQPDAGYDIDLLRSILLASAPDSQSILKSLQETRRDA